MNTKATIKTSKNKISGYYQRDFNDYQRVIQKIYDHQQSFNPFLTKSVSCPKVNSNYNYFQDSQNQNQNFYDSDTKLLENQRYEQEIPQENNPVMENQMEKDPHSTHLKMLLINLLSPVRDAQQIEDLCKNGLDSQILDNEYKKQFLYAFVFYCYFNDASELGIEICNLFYDNQVVDEVCFFYIASLYARKMMIEKACFHLERALQLHPADVDMEFLSIDATLGDIPEIKALLDIYVLPAQEF